jgi:BioD-like phosphotransacetylase family protein
MIAPSDLAPMTRKLFIAATGQHCGKTTVSLSLFHLLKGMGEKVGFIKPVGQVFVNYKGFDLDKDAALMAEVFNIDEEDLPYISPVIIKPGVTKQVLSGKISTEDYIQKIEEARAYFEAKYDWLVIEGTGHAAVGTVVGINNAVSARLFEASVLLVTGGGIGNVIDRVYSNSLVFQAQGVKVSAVMPNKLLADKRDQVLFYLKKALGEQGLKMCHGMSFRKELAHPSFRQLAKLFNETPKGNVDGFSRIVMHTQVTAASIHRMAHILEDDSTLVIPGTRDEMIISMASMYRLPEFSKKIAGIILSGEPPVNDLARDILNSSGVPHFKTRLTSMECIERIRDYQSKLDFRDVQKIELLKELASEQLDIEALKALFSA